MRFVSLAGLAALAASVAAAGGSAAPALSGVPHPERARIDYMLKCQGCHQPDGRGNMANTPPLLGEVSKFLRVPGGREFLGRVPGVASIDLDDARLAELLNWTLYRFDPGHIPAGFKPYSPAEIGALRKAPLRLEREAMRKSLVAHIGQIKIEDKLNNIK